MGIREIAGLISGGPQLGFDDSVWISLEARYGIALPSEYKEFVGLYGSGELDNFLSILRPGVDESSLEVMQAAMGPLYAHLSPGKIPYPILPDEGGIFLWGTTAEGDGCFLIPRDAGEWGVGIWFRQWAQWWESEDGFTDWATGVLSGAIVIDGFPVGRLGFSSFTAM